MSKVTELCANLRQSDGPGNVFLKVFYTDDRMGQETLQKIKDYTQQLGRNDLAIWVHIEKSSKVNYDIYYGPGLEERLTKDFLIIPRNL